MATPTKEQVLEAIQHLQPNATLTTILDYLKDNHQMGILHGSKVICHLYDMEEEGTLTSTWGGARKAGGPRPRLYAVV